MKSSALGRVELSDLLGRRWFLVPKCNDGNTSCEGPPRGNEKLVGGICRSKDIGQRKDQPRTLNHDGCDPNDVAHVQRWIRNCSYK